MLLTCVICNEPVPKASNRAGNEEDPEITNKFFMVLERYLGVKYFGGVGGEKEERGRLQFLLQQVMNTGLRFCGECSKIAESFCELFHQLKSIELLINWKLEALSEVLTIAVEETPIKMADFDKNSKPSEIDGVRTTKIIRLVMDFKRDLIKNCDNKLKTSSPKLQLHNCQRKSKDDGSLGTNPILLRVSLPPKNVQSVSAGLKPMIAADKEHQPSHEDMDTYSPPSTQSDPADVDFVLGTYNETETSQDILPPSPLSGSHLEIETVPETTNTSSVEDHDPQTATDNLANSHRKKKKTTKPTGDGAWEEETEEDDDDDSLDIPPPVLTQCAIKPPPMEVAVNPDTGKYKCNLCPKEFRALKHYRGHYRFFHSKIRHECTLCQKGFIREKLYQEHYKTVHAGLAYKCPKCEKTFTSQGSYGTHLKGTKCGVAEGSDFIAKCDICAKSFNSHFSLRYHLRSIHAPPGTFKRRKYKKKSKGRVKPVPAPIPPPLVSGKGPKSVVDLITGKVKCTVCAQEFENRTSCSIHFDKSHFTVKFQCSFCKREYSSHGGYRSHYLSFHEGNRTICQKCGKVFTRHYSYLSHLKATTCGGEDNIAKCDICGKTFTTRPNLRTHIRTVHHEPEVRKHLCDICGNGYKLKGDLNRHRKKVHPEVVAQLEESPEVAAQVEENPEVLQVHDNPEVSAQVEDNPEQDPSEATIYFDILKEEQATTW